MGQLVEELHATYQALGLFTSRDIVPAGGKILIQLVLSHLQAFLEGRHASQIGTVLQILQLLAPAHLLQEELGVLHRHFERQLATPQGQQVEGTARCALEGLVGLVEARRLLQRQALLAIAGVSEAIGVHGLGQLAIARRQLHLIHQKGRLQLEQRKMTGTTHNNRLRR